MPSLKSLALSVTAAAVLGLTALPALADATITVSLWDKGPDSMANIDSMEAITLSSHADMANATMGITLDTDTVAAGEITFEATNDSENFEHEMIVIPLTDPATLPYNTETMRIDEDAAGAIGEIPELEPGAKGTAAFRLEPGTYLLVCNIEGHYAMGMWTLLTVTE